MLIFLATAAALPHLAKDEPLLVPALRALGAQVEIQVWSDPEILWQRADLVLVRTCWDYIERPQEFRAWLERLDTLQVPTRSPLPTICWNLSKSYLLALRDHAGHRLPTTLPLWAPTLDHGALAAFFEACPQAVAKPVIGSGAQDTWRIDGGPSPGDLARLEQLVCHQNRSMLLQDFLPHITTQGEWSCVFFGGTFSHAVLKCPAPGEFRVQDDWGGSVHHLPPPPQILRSAHAILDTLHRLLPPLLYARIDLVEDPSSPASDPWLMECELIEPELFLGAPGAASRFAKAIMHECMNA